MSLWRLVRGVPTTYLSWAAKLSFVLDAVLMNHYGDGACYPVRLLRCLVLLSAHAHAPNAVTPSPRSAGLP